MARMQSQRNSGVFSRGASEVDVPLPHPPSGPFAALIEREEGTSFPPPPTDNSMDAGDGSSIPKYEEPFDGALESGYETTFTQVTPKRRPSVHTDSGKGTGDETDSSVAPAPPPFRPRLIHHTPKMRASRRKEIDTPNFHQQVVREDTAHGIFVQNPMYSPQKAIGYWQSYRIPDSTANVWKPIKDEKHGQPNQGSVESVKDLHRPTTRRVLHY